MKNKVDITLSGLVIYSGFLLATTFFAMTISEYNMFYITQITKRLFLTHEISNEYGFELAFNDLITVDDWWLFAKNVLVKNIAKFGPKKDPTFGGYAFVMFPILRQLRVRNDTCNINTYFRNLYYTCYGEYSTENENFDNFRNGTYMTALNGGGTSLWGQVETYKGTGYVERLSLDIDENIQTLDHLEKNNWIDRATRAVIIEFALFNANTNLFCNIKLLTEIPSTGAIVSSSIISPLKYSILGKGFLKYVSALLFYGFVIYYTIDLIITIIKNGIGSLWNLIIILDMIIIFIGHICLVYIIWHNFYLKAILRSDKIWTLNFNLDTICEIYIFFISAVGLCVFLVWIKLIMYVKLHRVMRKFIKTLQVGIQDLLGFAIMFSIVFLAYANLSILIFGPSLEDFRDFRHALLSSIRMVLCDFDYTQVEEEYPILAPFFFLSYILLVYFILVNMFLAILYDSYSEVRTKLKCEAETKLKDDFMFMCEKFKKIFSRKRNTSIHSSKYLTKTSQNIKSIKEQEIKILNTYFEVLTDQCSKEETDGSLYDMVLLLEKSLDNMVVKLENVLKKMKKTDKKLKNTVT